MNNTHFGPVEVSIDDETRQATLTLKRYKDPLPDRVLAGLRKWALSIIEADHPDFTIDDQTGLE